MLRATLEIASGNASSVSHYQRAVDTSLVEISRVTETMGYLQELVRIARDAAVGSLVDLAPVMAVVREDLRCVFQAAGTELTVCVPEGLPHVMVSAARLRQCLFHLLQHAVKECDGGGAVEVLAGAMDREVRIVVRTTCARSAHENGDEWSGVVPCLTLVETLAKVHGGRLEWKAGPFMAWLSLPAATERSAAWAGEADGCVMHEQPLVRSAL